jgi:hypothetical protein
MLVIKASRRFLDTQTALNQFFRMEQPLFKKPCFRAFAHVFPKYRSNVRKETPQFLAAWWQTILPRAPVPAISELHAIGCSYLLSWEQFIYLYATISDFFQAISKFRYLNEVPAPSFNSAPASWK